MEGFITSPKIVDNVVSFLRDQITEESTDELIDYLLARARLPRIVPKWLARRVLDRMLPGLILDGLAMILHRKAKDPEFKT